MTAVEHLENVAEGSRRAVSRIGDDPLTVGSLFSGIGGFDLGLERAGMTIKWQVEIDDFCNKVLEKHWPDVKRYRDIKELRGDELEPVDLICGGIPMPALFRSREAKKQGRRPLSLA